MKTRFLGLTLGLLSCAACGGGPVDGTWRVSSLTCNGAAQPIGDFRVTFNNTTGTFVQKFSDTCVATLAETYSYPDANTISIMPQTIACEPNAGCGALFGGQRCYPLPPTSNFTYVLSGSSLTLKRTSSGPADPCPVGQEVLFVMARQ